jgi:hypothetical protein
MATSAQMRKLALALPETEEKSHFAQPDFRVAGKIFAGLSTDETRGNLKLAPEVQATVVGGESDAFTPAAGAWGRSGWTYVDLAKVDAGTLEQLILEAWRIVAPKRVVAAFDTGGAPTPARPRAKTKAKPKPKPKTKAKPKTRPKANARKR